MSNILQALSELGGACASQGWTAAEGAIHVTLPSHAWQALQLELKDLLIQPSLISAFASPITFQSMAGPILISQR